MKILIVNYRYYISGGPERYLFNIIELLEKNGHTVIIFSVKNKFNIKSKYEKYFLSAVGKGTEIYANQYRRDIKTIIKVITRFFYSYEARRKLVLLVKEERPDIALIIHYQNKISCSVIDVLFKMRIPIIHRISDFGHICSNSILFNVRKNKICEACLNYNSKKYAIVNRCVGNSILYSLIKVLSLNFEEILSIQNKIDYYIFPSKFTMNKYIKYGILKNKCVHIPTFIDASQYENEYENIKYSNFALYIGRISPEKGIFTLVNAFLSTEYNLKLIGFSGDGYDKFILNYLQGKKHKIEYLGKMDINEIKYYLINCLFTIVPSECYDNMPNSILESYAFKKPVLVSDLPNFREYVINNETGIYFKVSNHYDLREKAQYLFNNQDVCKNMGENCYRLVNQLYSPDLHYKKLLEVFSKAL